MKKRSNLLIIILLGSSISFGQMIKSNDKSPTLPVLPTTPEKPKKYVVDLKYKSILKNKELVTINAIFNYYTRAQYQVAGNAAGYKIRDKKSKFILRGVSDATFQEITDEGYKYLKEQLAAKGYSFQPYSKFSSAKGYEKVEEKLKHVESHEESKSAGRWTKCFVAENQPIHGNTPMATYKVMKDLKTTSMINVGFTLDFISFGQEIGSTSTEVTWQLLYEPALSGGLSMSITNPKLQAGSVAVKGGFRHPKQDFLTFTDEAIDGHYVVDADEEKYKTYAIAYIKSQVDLLMYYIKMEYES